MPQSPTALASAAIFQERVNVERRYAHNLPTPEESAAVVSPKKWIVARDIRTPLRGSGQMLIARGTVIEDAAVAVELRAAGADLRALE
jgi:hypothetical protein